MSEEQYFVSFRGYGILVLATNIDDAIILGKSNAIYKRHIRPKVVSVKLFDGTMIYYCGVCGNVPVERENGVCATCPSELALENGNEKSGTYNAPLTPEEEKLIEKKSLPDRPMTFEEFLKEFGGRWDTHDSGGRFHSEEQYYEAEMKLEQLRKTVPQLMGLDFGEFCTKYCLRFSLDFLSRNGVVKIYAGENWEEQSFRNMKEVFVFMRREVEKHFKLIPATT